MRTLKSLFARVAPPAVTVGGLLIVWEIAVDAGHISQRVLASPSQIAASIIKTWPDLWEATAITTYEAITGFLIAAVAGVLIGIGLYVSKTLYRGIYPLLAAAQTIPLITIAPLFMIWFGFEPLGKIVIVAVFGVFPVAVQTCRGMLAVPQFYEDVALTCGATRAWALWHVKLRVAARQVFGGLRISAAYVFGTAVTAEYLGAMNGLGIWLQAAFNSFRTPLIFSATIMVVALTALLLTIISLAERLLLGPDDTNRVQRRRRIEPAPHHSSHIRPRRSTAATVLTPAPLSSAQASCRWTNPTTGARSARRSSGSGRSTPHSAGAPQAGRHDSEQSAVNRIYFRSPPRPIRRQAAAVTAPRVAWTGRRSRARTWRRAPPCCGARPPLSRAASPRRHPTARRHGDVSTHSPRP